VPGLSIGYEHSFIHQVADFLNSLDGDKPAEPTFEDAMQTERVVDAVLRSAESGKWEKAC
jgi:predicted dehydrogenase